MSDNNNNNNYTADKPNTNIKIENEDIHIQTSEEKFKGIFMGTIFTIVLLLIGLSYGITWAALFIRYTDENKYQFQEECKILIKWDRALYIVLIITSALHLISSIIQIIASAKNKDSSIPQYITFSRSYINYIAGIVILIGINVEYFNLDQPKLCGKLAKLNLAYIIIEWSMMGIFIGFVLVVCLISLLLKKKKDKL